jgi:hypothetical protein
MTDAEQLTVEKRITPSFFFLAPDFHDAPLHVRGHLQTDGPDQDIEVRADCFDS